MRTSIRRNKKSPLIMNVQGDSSKDYDELTDFRGFFPIEEVRMALQSGHLIDLPSPPSTAVKHSPQNFFPQCGQINNKCVTLLQFGQLVKKTCFSVLKSDTGSSNSLV